MQTIWPRWQAFLSYAPPYAARLGPDSVPQPAPKSFSPSTPPPLIHTTVDGDSLQHELASPALFHAGVQAFSGLKHPFSSICMADTLAFNDGHEQWSAHMQQGSTRYWAPTRTPGGHPAAIMRQITAVWLASDAFQDCPPLVITSAGKETSSLQHGVLEQQAEWHLDVTAAAQALLAQLFPDLNRNTNLLFGLGGAKALMLGFPGIRTPVLWLPHTHPCQVAASGGACILPGNTVDALLCVVALHLTKVVLPDASGIKYTSPGMASRGGECAFCTWGGLEECVHVCLCLFMVLCVCLR